jgi:hypothetical protein
VIQNPLLDSEERKMVTRNQLFYGYWSTDNESTGLLITLPTLIEKLSSTIKNPLMDSEDSDKKSIV